jgi:hypothetical protein
LKQRIGKSLLLIFLMAGGLLLTAAMAMAALTELKGSFVTIPEPATMLLFGTGLMSVASAVRKKFAKS